MIRLVTLIAQKNVVAEHPYVTFLRISRMSEPVDIALKFRDKYVFASVRAGKHDMKKVEFSDGGKDFKHNSSFNMNMIIFRNGQCSRRNKMIVRFIKKNYVFIQTDKPIYKPGDTIQYRIVVLDHQMKPKFFNNLKIQFIMPGENSMGVFVNLTKRISGLYEDKFELNLETSLGDWQIKATVEKKVTAMKKFKVEKYILPLYKLYVHAPSKVSLKEKKIVVVVEAKYSFGGYVSGSVTAKLQYKGSQKGVTLNSSMDGQWIFEANLENDFGIKRIASDPTIYELVVDFKDDNKISSQVEVVKIAVYADRYCVIKCINKPKAQGSLSYSLDVIVEDFDGNLVVNSSNNVIATLYQGDHTQITKAAIIKEGIASFNFEEINDGTDKLIKIEYKNCKTQVNIEEEKLNEALYVKYSPVL